MFKKVVNFFKTKFYNGKISDNELWTYALTTAARMRWSEYRKGQKLGENERHDYIKQLILSKELEYNSDLILDIDVLACSLDEELVAKMIRESGIFHEFDARDAGVPIEIFMKNREKKLQKLRDLNEKNQKKTLKK